MIFWRVSNYGSLDGIGGLLIAGRWHSKGHPVVYCSLNPATALLETLVHLEIDSEDRPAYFQVLKIEVPDTVSLRAIQIASLPADWRSDSNATRAIGDAWLTSVSSLILQVPSALVPETSNLLINPAHGEARALKIIATYRHPFDERLL